MRSAVALGVAALMTTLVWTNLALADPTPKPKAPVAAKNAVPKKLPTVAAKRTASNAKTTSTRNGHAVAVVGSTSSSHLPASRKVIVTRRKVNGRWVRVTQIVRKPAGPSYQTHPDPERYQQIQQALADSGYFKGEVNGQWGDDSVAALKRFQTDKNLPNDGKISALSLIGLGLGPRREVATGGMPVNGPAVVAAPPAATSEIAPPVAKDAPRVAPPVQPESQQDNN